MPPETMVMSLPMLQQRTMSAFMTLHQLGSMSLFMVHFTTEGHADAFDLGCYLGPC